MADESGAEPLEGDVAEYVIRVLVRVDHKENRLVRSGAYRGEQPLAHWRAAARVDDGHALLADDEADIGDVAFILLAHKGDRAGMGVNAWRDLLDRQGSESLSAGRADCGERQNNDEKEAYRNAHDPASPTGRDLATEEARGNESPAREAAAMTLLRIALNFVLAPQIRPTYVFSGFGCTSVGEREIRHTYRRQSEIPRKRENTRFAVS